MKLSIALAVHNEESNIAKCLGSIKEIANEIVVVDGSSNDGTVEIAKSYGAKVIVTNNPAMFHINKMKAVEASSGDWILQLDADERVTPELAKEIKKIIDMSDSEIDEYEHQIKNIGLFTRHQKILEERDGKIGDELKPFAAFFIPRSNFFLGKYLMHGGVYPDGVIRLFRKGKAYLPCKDIHEQYVIDGKVGWLENNILHYDSPTFKKYITRNSRYVNLLAEQLKEENIGKNPITAIDYILFKPFNWFFLTFFRHKGFLDSWQGFVFSFFSSLRFPRAYLQYLRMR